jgi:hypothetical protein
MLLEGSVWGRTRFTRQGPQVEPCHATSKRFPSQGRLPEICQKTAGSGLLATEGVGWLELREPDKWIAAS